MEQRKYKTKAEVLARGQEAVGKTLGEIDKTGRIATGKGAIGTVVEESWFGYKPNSNPAPDFEATTIVRRNDRFAADETDGEIVYDGEGECYTDSGLEKATYYYAAFSHDDLKNYSAFTEAATWKYTVTTGVDGNKRVDFTVAPNPVREYVTVTFPGDSVSELSVINSQGEIVMREKLKESVTSLPVEGLSPGIYLVSVKSSGQIYNRKIVVE